MPQIYRFNNQMVPEYPQQRRRPEDQAAQGIALLMSILQHMEGTRESRARTALDERLATGQEEQNKFLRREAIRDRVGRTLSNTVPGNVNESISKAIAEQSRKDNIILMKGKKSIEPHFRSAMKSLQNVNKDSQALSKFGRQVSGMVDIARENYETQKDPLFQSAVLGQIGATLQNGMALATKEGNDTLFEVLQEHQRNLSPLVEGMSTYLTNRENIFIEEAGDYKTDIISSAQSRMGELTQATPELRNRGISEITTLSRTPFSPKYAGLNYPDINIPATDPTAGRSEAPFNVKGIAGLAGGVTESLSGLVLPTLGVGEEGIGTAEMGEAANLFTRMGIREAKKQTALPFQMLGAVLSQRGPLPGLPSTPPLELEGLSTPSSVKGEFTQQAEKKNMIDQILQELNSLAGPSASLANSPVVPPPTSMGSSEALLSTQGESLGPFLNELTAEQPLPPDETIRAMEAILNRR